MTIRRSTLVAALAVSVSTLGITPSHALFGIKVKVPNPIKVVTKAAKQVGGDITHPLRPLQRTERNIKQTVKDVSHGRFRPGQVVSAAAPPGAAPFTGAANPVSGPRRR